MNLYRPSVSTIKARLTKSAIRKACLGGACVAILATAGSLQASAQDQSYGSYLRQSAAIERNATNSTNAALRTISQSIARDGARMNTIVRNYTQQNYRRLYQQYYTSGAYRSMRFEQFANKELMSHATIAPDTSAFAAGRAAHEAQVENFNRRQSAAQAQRDAGESLIHHMQKNSDSLLTTVDHSIEGSIRGNSAFINPSSGKAQWMPTNSPGLHQATDGMNYLQDRNGRYYQQQGSSWTQMQPAGR